MTRSLARRLLPFWLRLEVARLRKMPAYWRERKTVAHRRAGPQERSAFACSLAAHRSPLERSPGQVDQRLQAGKERNVALAVAAIDGIVLAPGQVFSYHHCVGRPSRMRGYRPGLELHDERMSAGVGGGCCMISNLLYLLALRAGMEIVERHRHALDLFPDHGRAVPFGCGATIYYNFADLRFCNPLSTPVMIALHIDERHLVGEIRSTNEPGHTVEVYEVDHHFCRTEDGWIRENHLRRRFLAADGSVMRDEEVAHNRARVLYDPEDC